MADQEVTTEDVLMLTIHYKDGGNISIVRHYPEPMMVKDLDVCLHLAHVARDFADDVYTELTKRILNAS